MSEQNIFEIASQRRYRYDSTRGQVTTEDLWMMPIADLDAIYVHYGRLLKENNESLLSRTRSDGEDPERIEYRIKKEIIGRVFEVRHAEQMARHASAERAEKKQRLLAILAQKEDEEFASKSADEIRGLIEELS